MKVYINLKETEISDHASVSVMLEERGISGAGVAVAVEDKVIPRKEWPSRELEPGAKITIIRAVCGG